MLPTRATGMGCLLMLAGACACARHAGDEPVARVDGSAITREQLDQAEQRISGGVPIDAAIRRKILDSLVLDRVLAREQERSLSADERRVLDADLQEHRDQVLARMYLAHHGAAGAPADEEVRGYYQQHASQFGGGIERRYEMVFATATLDDKQREAVLAGFTTLKSDAHWEAAAEHLAGQKLPVSFSRGSSNDALLDQRLKHVLESLHKDGAAQLTLIDGRPHLLRVVEEVPGTPQPLAQVRASIEQALAAQRVRRTLDVVAPDALKRAHVEYVEASAP